MIRFGERLKDFNNTEKPADLNIQVTYKVGEGKLCEVTPAINNSNKVENFVADKDTFFDLLMEQQEQMG